MYLSLEFCDILYILAADLVLMTDPKNNIAVKQTLSLIILFIFMICVFQMICHIRKNQDQKEIISEKLETKNQKIKQKNMNEIENENRYKTPNSITRREYRSQSRKGLNLIPGSHVRDSDSYRTASRNTTMNTTNEKFEESFEFSNRSTFQPAAKTASRDSVI